MYVSYIMPSSLTDFFIPCKLRDQVLSPHLMISNFGLQAKKGKAIPARNYLEDGHVYNISIFSHSFVPFPSVSNLLFPSSDPLPYRVSWLVLAASLFFDSLVMRGWNPIRNSFLSLCKISHTCLR